MRPAPAIGLSAKLLLCFGLVAAMSSGPSLWLLHKTPALPPGTLATAALAIACQLVITLVLAHWLRGEIDRPLRAAGQLAACMACGDLSTHDAPVPHDGSASDALLTTLQGTNDRLAAMVHRVRVGTETMARNAAQVAHGSRDLSLQASHQAGALGAAAIHLHAARSALADPEACALQARALAATAAARAATGRAALASATSAIASVDAAAASLRALAGQGDVARQIGAAQEQVAGAARALARASMGMGELAASAQRVALVTGRMADAVPAQLAAVNRVGGCIAGIELLSQGCAAMLQSMTAAADGLRDDAHRLSAATAAFVVGQHHGRSGPPLHMAGGAAILVLRPAAARHVGGQRPLPQVRGGVIAEDGL